MQLWWIRYSQFQIKAIFKIILEMMDKRKAWVDIYFCVVQKKSSVQVQRSWRKRLRHDENRYKDSWFCKWTNGMSISQEAAKSQERAGIIPIINPPCQQQSTVNYCDLGPGISSAVGFCNCVWLKNGNNVNKLMSDAALEEKMDSTKCYKNISHQHHLLFLLFTRR